MKTLILLFPVLLLFFNVQGFSQNLEVTGIVKANGLLQSVNGGVKFPDQTVQTTAAFNTNQNAFPKGQPFVLITTTNPVITDTLEVVELIEGGMEVPANSSAIANNFVIKLNLENATQYLAAKLFSFTTLTKFTIYFPDPNVPNSFIKTIELRSATLKKMVHSANSTGNSNYAHLTDVTVAFQQIEVRTINNGATNCYCWNFLAANACNCD